MTHYADKYNRMLKKTTSTPPNKNPRPVKKKETIFNKPWKYQDFIYAPDGYEGVVLTIYIILFPYLFGLAFLYFFIAEGNIGAFIEFDVFNFLIIWAIGYEVIAGIALIWIGFIIARYFSSDEQIPDKRDQRNRW